MEKSSQKLKATANCCDGRARFSLVMVFVLALANTVMHLSREKRLMSLDSEIKSLQQKVAQRQLHKPHIHVAKLGQLMNELKEALQQGNAVKFG